ncbi:antichymotrypsin-2-like isoform X2 [Odontomachus brunneus]|uniref:antichymotrypsin-2-like isoform X2 n=1 Tax=Odontomachus brunneus TaxID=486640 RepID=UPI0013F25D6C|nr:antichymotrypsin-2-like isoform X2 [Odontomachus brunneus]
MTKSQNQILLINQFEFWIINHVQRGLLVLCIIASTMAVPTPIPASYQTVTQGARLFSTDFVKIIAKEKSENLICSPLSADVALSMAAIGSEGKTKEQFKNVLKLPETQPQTLEGYQQLISSLNDVDNVTLKLANKIFIGQHFPVKPEYKNALQTYFYSDIQSVDFTQNQQAATTINNWCKEKTNNRINNIVTPEDLDDSTALVLANAVYFKGKWAKEFDPKNTEDRPFHINANTVKNVPTMYRKGYYKFVEMPEHNVKCIEIPYANTQVSMVIILPNEIDGLTALTNNLDAITEACNTHLSEIHEREVKLYLPKFKIESELNLKDMLSDKMGLSLPFSDNANFSNISAIPLKISKVVQKAFIEVNEEGSEAAAVTAIRMVAYSAIEISKVVEIKVDRPFVYAIIKLNRNDESSVPLFVGYISELAK